MIATAGMNVTTLRKAVLLTAGLCYGTNAQAQSQYPFVFDSVHELKRYGLALVMDP